MAYIIGLVSPDEEKELEARGWEVEDPRELVIPAEEDEPEEYPGERMRMVWVDNDMLDIMSGPDWDKSHEDGSVGIDGMPTKAQEGKSAMESPSAVLNLEGVPKESKTGQAMSISERIRWLISRQDKMGEVATKDAGECYDLLTEEDIPRFGDHLQLLSLADRVKLLIARGGDQ